MVLIRVAIVEDEPDCAQLLRGYLLRYQESAGISIEVDTYHDGMDAVENYRPIYDILLLDIEMPQLDGMTAAGRIRRSDPDVIMMFITNMAKYAIKGYEVGALDFVLKPVSYFAFSLKMDKALACLQGRTQKNLMVPAEDATVKLPASDITYIEVINHRLHIHTTEGKVFTMLGTLSEMEDTLADAHFARCNKGYLVNLRHIARINSNSVVVGGDELIISRRRKEEFLLTVTDYYGGGGR